MPERADESCGLPPEQRGCRSLTVLDLSTEVPHQVEAVFPHLVPLQQGQSPLRLWQLHPDTSTAMSRLRYSSREHAVAI